MLLCLEKFGILFNDPAARLGDRHLRRLHRNDLRDDLRLNLGLRIVYWSNFFRRHDQGLRLYEVVHLGIISKCRLVEIYRGNRVSNLRMEVQVVHAGRDISWWRLYLGRLLLFFFLRLLFGCLNNPLAIIRRVLWVTSRWLNTLLK